MSEEKLEVGEHQEQGRGPVDPTYGLPVVMTADETARFLRLNVKTVNAAIAAGKLPARRVGRRTVIFRDTLLDWLRERQGRAVRARRPR